MFSRIAALCVTIALIAVPTAAGTAPEELEYACGGGVTGGSSGTVIRSDGRITRWKQPRANAEREKRELPRNLQGATELFAKLRELDFRQIASGKVDYNWRCWLSLRHGGGVHTVSWTLASPVPAEILRMVREIGESESPPDVQTEREKD